MPVNEAAFLEAATASVAAYRTVANAVRTGTVIAPYHRFCSLELSARGLPPALLHPPTEPRPGPRRVHLSGGYIDKEVDVCLNVPNTPLLAISVKSQMSSIVKNTMNRFEEYVGDATNLHTRYPMLVVGFMMVVPVHDETFRNGQPTEGLLRIARLLENANDRIRQTDPPGSYEATALVLVDGYFGHGPVERVLSFPPDESPLRVERFFDQAVQLMLRRNQFVNLVDIAKQVTRGREREASRQEKLKHLQEKIREYRVKPKGGRNNKQATTGEPPTGEPPEGP